MASSSVESVAVIGCGASGLTAIKWLLDYGFRVTAFEKSDDIGGIWKHGIMSPEGSLLKEGVLSSSKEFLSFSDFPFTRECPNLVRRHHVHGYILAYADRFSLRQHIRFNTRVKLIERAIDYSTTGAWTITYTRVPNGTLLKETFDAVMLCIGHHTHPYVPIVSGIEKFEGRVLHSHDYRNSNEFIGKKVLIVGMGNSGGYICAELCHIAKQVFGSSRHGVWIARRLSNGGYPWDVIERTRYWEMIKRLMPTALREFLAERSLNAAFDHSMYGIRPNDSPCASPPLFSDELPLLIASGSLILKTGISHFSERRVHFVDGTTEAVDDVIFCTGYSFSTDVVEGGRLIPVEDNQVRLYKGVFAPELAHNSLAVIGLIEPVGISMMVAEMQARTAAHIWANDISLPSASSMQNTIDEEKSAIALQFTCAARRAYLQIDYIAYMDELASMIGAMPELSWRSAFNDPQLFIQVYFGPCSSHQYRLKGPSVWCRARAQLLCTGERVRYSMNTRRRADLACVQHRPPSPPDVFTSLLTSFQITFTFILLLAIFLKFFSL